MNPDPNPWLWKETEKEGGLAEMLAGPAVRHPPPGPLLPDAGVSPDLSEPQVSASDSLGWRRPRHVGRGGRALWVRCQARSLLFLFSWRWEGSTFTVWGQLSGRKWVVVAGTAQATVQTGPKVPGHSLALPVCPPAPPLLPVPFLLKKKKKKENYLF